MTLINSEGEGGESGSHSRTGGGSGTTAGGGADRQSGWRRRRIRIGIGATAAAAVALIVAPQVQFTNEPYAENLQMIRAQTGRNTNQDASPQRDVEQDELDISTGGGLVDTNRAAYLGSPNSNPEQSFPVPDGGQFRTACEFSHFAYDDPILFPRQPGAAHLHMFFGNTDANAYSTYDTLIDSGSSTCNGAEANRTGYWAPAMIDGDGNVRIPERVVVYYKGEGLAQGMRSASCCGGTGSEPYRPHMAMIAPLPPNSVAQIPASQGGAQGEVNYKCTNNFSPFQYVAGVATIPNCDGDYYINTFGAPYPATRTVLEMEVKFWNCHPPTPDTPLGDWTQWTSNQPGGGVWFFSNCGGVGGGPNSTNETFPNMSYFVNYVVEPGEDTSSWFLSSDVDPATITATNPTVNRGSGHHGDWWGGWHPDINQEFLDNCVNFWANNGSTASGCGFGYLSDGGPNSANPLPGRTLTYRQQYDTVGNTSSYKIPLATLFAEICQPLGPSHTFSAGQNPARGAYCAP